MKVIYLLSVEHYHYSRLILDNDLYSLSLLYFCILIFFLHRSTEYGPTFKIFILHKPVIITTEPTGVKVNRGSFIFSAASPTRSL